MVYFFMLSAAIDVGSNTIRLLIGQVINKKIHRYFSDRSITRLVEGLNNSGFFKKSNMESSINVLRNISRFISEYNVVNIRAVGTAALREARNSNEFIEKVLQETGILIRVISGEEEAQLTLQGVLSGLDISERILIVDVGGGSTEWIFNGSDEVSSPIFGTIPIGVLKLLEGCIMEDPPSLAELSSVEDTVESYLKPLVDIIPRIKPNVLVGTGGTITTLASIDLSLESYQPEIIHGHKLGLNRLLEMKDWLVSMPINKRRKIKGLEPERADIIIPGIILTIKIMEAVGINELIVSDYGILEGLLLGIED